MNESAALALMSSALLALSIWRLGLVRPGYSHVSHTISELGELGAPRSRLVSFGVFLPFGGNSPTTAVLTCSLARV